VNRSSFSFCNKGSSKKITLASFYMGHLM